MKQKPKLVDINEAREIEPFRDPKFHGQFFAELIILCQKYNVRLAGSTEYGEATAHFFTAEGFDGIDNASARYYRFHIPPKCKDYEEPPAIRMIEEEEVHVRDVIDQIEATEKG